MHKLNIFAETICAFVTKQMFMTYKYRAEQKLLDKQRTKLYYICEQICILLYELVLCIEVIIMTKYEAVAQAIKTDIENGLYKEGKPIPTEELLTVQYDVSRQTIRKALSLLVEDNLILKRQGSGSVVRPKRLNPRTGKIAVVATYISDYIFPSQLRAVNDVLSENKYTAVLSATRNCVCNERAILEEILKNPVDGILIEGTKSAMPNPNFDLYEKLIEMDIPVVFFNGYYPSLSGTYSVCADNQAGGAELVRHLIERGHTKIAGFFKSDDIQGHQRYSGFISELFRNGLIIPDENVFWYITETKEELFNNPQEVLNRLGDNTAVVCYNDEVAFGLIKCLLSAGRRVPEDVAVVSFDNSNLSRISPVTITSLSYEDRNIGKIAAQKLVDILNGKGVTSEVLPWTFIQKESS